MMNRVSMEPPDRNPGKETKPSSMLPLWEYGFNGAPERNPGKEDSQRPAESAPYVRCFNGAPDRNREGCGTFSGLTKPTRGEPFQWSPR